MVSEDFQHIEFDQLGHVGLIRLNRPDAMNAFTGRMGAEWSAAYEACDRNDEIRVVVVTGNGRAFCAGADMSGGADTFASSDLDDFSTCPVKPAWDVRKPVIAAMNGHAIGLGFSLALQCDFRVVARQAKYGLLQVRRGVLADACMHWLLPRLVGQATASEILLLGRTYDGGQLFAKGLANNVVEGSEVLQTALELADELATQCAPLVSAMAKRLVWESAEMSVTEMEARETCWLQHSMGKGDAIEGGTAFVERRAPRWSASVSKEWPAD